MWSKTFLVTGADGFAGSNLCESLANKGAQVKALVSGSDVKNHLSHKNIEYHMGDIQDYVSVKNAVKGVDVIYHLAAITVIPETRAKVMNTYMVNSTGTLNILHAAREAKVSKIIYASTCHVYGNQSQQPIGVDAIPHPIDIYSASKLSAEHLCQSYNSMFDMNIIITRAFNHFGPRQRTHFLVSSAINKFLNGGETIKMGNPRPTRDYTYVDDIVKGYLLVAEAGRRGQVYHLCSGRELSVREIVEKIKEIGGFTTDVDWDTSARRIDIERMVGDFTDTKDELGWQPEISFEEGLGRTIQWQKQSLVLARGEA